MEQMFQFDYTCKLCKKLLTESESDDHIKEHNYFSDKVQSCVRCGRETHNVYHDKPMCVYWCAEVD